MTGGFCHKGGTKLSLILIIDAVHDNSFLVKALPVLGKGVADARCSDVACNTAIAVAFVCSVLPSHSRIRFSENPLHKFSTPQYSLISQLPCSTLPLSS